MCGRFTLRTPAAILKDYFGLGELPGFDPRYNIAPTQSVGAIRSHAGAPAWDEMRWGLVPAWAKDISIGNRLINARAETIASKPAFRDAFERRRCLIPADGFYEWQQLDRGGKQPYHLRLRDDGLFAFAGLWERWRERSGAALLSCAIVTTEPNELVAPIHDRMPVMLDHDGATEWLRADVVPDALGGLLQPYPAERMRAVPVASIVNRADNDVPACIEPLPVQPAPVRLF